MKAWPKHPLIYEINTWVWLDELGRGAGERLSLATVPDSEWDRIAGFGFDAVWLMGVWERSPEGIRVSMQNERLLADFKRTLPDFEEHDNVGSPYCVRRYVVDAHLGGPEALDVARCKLADRGLRLILDFVPNHVAPDHPWVYEHPEYFIQGNADDLARDPASFLSRNGRIFACGRDPFFPAWSDVLQLNAFAAELRTAITDTLDLIAGQCDGVRCDMAMLLMNTIFQDTWGSRAGERPPVDYWRAIIPSVKEKHDAFLFIAEAYWDLEWELQQQGFDYCYDKRLYDRLEHDPAESVRLHLCAELPYQEKLVRFIENHDEPRAAAVFEATKNRAAAVTALTLPGARLVHEGQMEGRRVRLPVFLARRPVEPPDRELTVFYQRLLAAITKDSLFSGTWRLCDRLGWPDNQSYLNLIAWCWHSRRSRCLIVVNFSDMPAQGLIKIPWEDLGDHRFRLMDMLSSTIYERDGNDLIDRGLFVDLAPRGIHFLKVHRCEE